MRKNIFSTLHANLPLLTAAMLGAAFFSVAQAAEQRLVSPDGKLAIIVSDERALNYRLEVDHQTIITHSHLGLEFKDGSKLGTVTTLVNTTRKHHDSHWENQFGQRRNVRDRWNELHLIFREAGAKNCSFGLIVRAYDDGVAFRYELPEASGLGQFILTSERTEFHFAGDYPCWYGENSACAENHYPEGKLSTIPAGADSVLPLLVQAPAAYVAIAEADLLDWAGMSITGTGSPKILATLAGRGDGNGLVVSATPRVSPWRVMMIGRQPADLVASDLIATLATPNRLTDTSWIKTGACAWDPWWTGVNACDSGVPTGLMARGTTAADEQYIDLAAEMAWPYQLIDWFWYKNMTSYDHSLSSRSNPVLADFTQSAPEIDLPGLVRHAREKNVRLFIWAHSLDIKTFGIEKSMTYFASQGLAGVKIDFLNSQSQETVEWCQQVLEAAARQHLMIDFHGTYKPTGLARTYPNFITQEGVLGNEYNKLPGNRCTPLHTITLPFTRELLGPMDFTPGGFVNRKPADFQITAPAQVMGTRARQLAMTVVYFSPLMVLCDSPSNYRGQAGLEFLRGLPTVWDETRVLEADVAKSLVVARRSGNRWYLAAMNGDDAATLPVSLGFLGHGKWTLHSFADQLEGSDYQAVVQARRVVDSTSNLNLNLCPAGGFAAVLDQ